MGCDYGVAGHVEDSAQTRRDRVGMTFHKLPLAPCEQMGDGASCVWHLLCR